ncbi:MAG: hypothetical protein HF300_18110 [Ignavibacteria bacterium]|jgi:hypothetical protein|nr:hypothetical protein [Ignavibacteria bacterium]
MCEEYNGPYCFELKFTNKVKLKWKDLFFKFIFDDYALRGRYVGYSALDLDEGKNTTVFELNFDELDEIFIAGYEFAIFVENEKKKLRLVK